MPRRWRDLCYWQAARMASVFLSAICGRKKYRMAHSPHSTLNTSRYRPPTASERVPICRADGAICVIGKHPAGICVPQCDLWAYKTPAWPHSTFRIQHSTFHIPHSTFHIPHSTFHIPRSTFHIPHSTYHIINSFSRLVSEQPLRLGTCCGGSSHASPHHLWCLRSPKVRIPVPPTAVGQRFSPCSYHCFAMVT